MTFRPLAAFCLLAAAMLAASPAPAETLPPEHAQVLAGRGAILPLAEVLRRMRPPVDGEIIEVALEREGSRYLYRIKALGHNGVYREYRADAENGASAKD